MARPRKLLESLPRYCLWLSLFLHLLLLLSFSLVLVPQAETDKTPFDFIPSYFYHEENSSVATPVPQQNKQKTDPTSKQGIEKPAPTAVSESEEVSQPTAVSADKNMQAVNLIGKKKLDKPLVAILGKAITAHLVYPRIAMDFNLRGTAYVRFILHPDGTVSNVQLVKSSSAEVLDEAAIAAISSISPVYNVGQYIQKPEVIVFGIIFG